MSDVIRISLPLTIWLVSFSLIYGLHGIICSSSWSTTPSLAGLTQGRLVLIAAFAMAVLMQAVTLAFLLSGRFGAEAGFMRWTSTTLAIVGLVAVLWTLLPVAVLPICN